MRLVINIKLYITTTVIIMAMGSPLAQKVIKPNLMIEASGDVFDIKIHQNKIYLATSNSTVDVFDINSGKQVKKISIPQIHDFAGDLINAKIYSVDVWHSNKPSLSKILFVAQQDNGKRVAYIYEAGKVRNFIKGEVSDPIKKAKFVDNNTVVLGLLSNELALFDIKTGMQIHRRQINHSGFSDFALSPDKKMIASTDESGDISIVNSNNLETYKILKGANKDNIYKVAFSKNYAAGAGQDRIGSLYKVETGEYEKFETDFLIYATAISQNEKYVAYAFTEDNDIAIFDINSSKLMYMLKGQKSTLNSIYFIDDNHVISGSDDKFVMLWTIQ